jgi:uncharacterized membrane protein (UPF0127 family)
MKRILLPLFVALLLAGCTGTSGTDQITPNDVSQQIERPVDKGENKVGENKDSKNNASDSKGEVSKDTDSKGDGSKATTADNPKRVFQLRELNTAQIEYNGKKINVWLMDNALKRTEGMMHLSEGEVPDGWGMLFVFEEEAQLAFWMRDTLIALDLAYIARDGKVVSVHQMKPLDENSVPAAGPATYVLEMKKGEFAKYGIKKGGVFKLPSVGLPQPN